MVDQGLTRQRSIAVVDDHQIIELAVSKALEGHSDIVLQGWYPTVPQLLSSRTPRPDLVLLDLRLEDESTPTANVAGLVGGGMAVLALTSGEDLSLVREVSRTRVLGVVRKSAAPHTIMRAIETALSGGTFVSAEFAHAINSDPGIEAAGLSPREQEVLELFASGATGNRIAEQLYLSPRTVETYIRRIREKYANVGRHAPTKIDLNRRAQEDGLL